MTIEAPENDAPESNIGDDIDDDTDDDFPDTGPKASPVAGKSGPVHTLTHYRLCPFSRSVRLILGEMRIAAKLVDERPWEWRPSLLALNPAGDLPVLQLNGGPILCGAYSIAEYISEDYARHADVDLIVPLFPGNREDRAEIRRLVDWFHRKFNAEVTTYLLEEKVYSRFRTASAGSPEPEALRAARTNIRYHLSYISYLMEERNWLAGDEMSYADMAAAAHFSVADYLGEVPWEERPAAKLWYARMKSRRSLRDMLAERVPGAPMPPPHYDDPDF